MKHISAILCATVLVIAAACHSKVAAQGGTGRITKEKPTPARLIRARKPNPAAPPFSKKGFVDAVASTGSQASLVQEVKRRGVNFDLTEEVEGDLSAKGVGSELMDAVGDNFRSDAVRGGVLTGEATNLVKPPYPAIARAARASGQVQVQVVIDENGDVIEAEAISGHPLLYAAAAGAARASKFKPTNLSGVPVKVTGIIVYNFQ